jgi:hypothetical protein
MSDRRRPGKDVRDATKLVALVLADKQDEAKALARQIESKAAARKS